MTSPSNSSSYDIRIVKGGVPHHDRFFGNRNETAINGSSKDKNHPEKQEKRRKVKSKEGKESKQAARISIDSKLLPECTCEHESIQNFIAEPFIQDYKIRPATQQSQSQIADRPYIDIQIQKKPVKKRKVSKTDKSPITMLLKNIREQNRRQKMLSVERHLAMQSYPYKKVQPPPITLQKTGHQKQNRNSRGTPLSRVQYLDDSKSQMIVGVLASNPDRTSESESGPNYITQD